eukprot:TRINITY_DN1012_c0_g1_i1.p1 TRINITY_DN1012_c0_g1~~TRINITY_DN1012_c0_g1_i1.p1  ORF type:complete len:754 (+),score=110.72 TRINITY_DN1012_c0_g1_i1:142-2403(+)
MMRRHMLSYLFLSSLLVCLISEQQYKTYDIEVASLDWSDSNVGFILDPTRGAYRTTNSGYDWFLLSNTSNVRMSRVVMDNVQRQSLMLFGSGGQRWASNDAGATLQYFSGNNFNVDVGTIRPHPRTTRLWLGMADCNTAASTCETIATSRNMFASSTYDKVSYPRLRRVEWGPQGDILYLTAAGEYGYMRSNITSGGDLSPVPIFPRNVFGLQITDRYIVIGYVSGTQAEIYVTNLNINPSGVDASLYFAASFPFGQDLPNLGYATLDSDPSLSLFLGHSSSASRDNGWGNMYMSDDDGIEFTLSMEHINLQFYYVDWMRILDGVHIANNVTNYDQYSSRKDLRSYITWDNGGRWSTLTPPEKDINGKPITCTGSCGLHLHGITAYVGGLSTYTYATDSVVGIVMGVGNVGETLQNDISLCNTYMSRDAGQPWKQVMQGGSTYEFANYGAILVMVTTTGQTAFILYSLDEGETLHTFQFTENSMSIQNVMSSPGGKSVLIMGEDTSGSNKLVTVDFSSLLTYECSDNDYEDWFTPQCILGAKTKYLRRKISSKCYNFVHLERIESRQPCPCTYDDWECDVAYETTNFPNGTFTCTLSGIVPPDPPEHCPPGKPYYVSKGYRKIAGDLCQGGLNFDAIKKTCPIASSTSASFTMTSSASSSSSSTSGGDVNPPSGGGGGGGSGAVIAVVIILIVVFIIVGVVVVYKVDSVRSRVMGVIDRIRAAGSRNGRHTGDYSHSFNLLADDDTDDGGGAL